MSDQVEGSIPRVPDEAVELAAEALWNEREYRDPSGDTPDDWYPPGDNPDQPPPREPDLWAPLAATGKYPASLKETRDDARAALAAALPAIHAERDRAWREGLTASLQQWVDHHRAEQELAADSDDPVAAKQHEVAADAFEDALRYSLAALDSLQVSGGAGLDAGDSDQRSTASAAETEAACSPAASVESSGTDKPQPEATDQQGGLREAAEWCDEQAYQAGEAAYQADQERERDETAKYEAVADAYRKAAAHLREKLPSPDTTEVIAEIGEALAADQPEGDEDCDDLCTCGHERFHHDDGREMGVYTNCKASGCGCKRFALAPDEPDQDGDVSITASDGTSIGSLEVVLGAKDGVPYVSLADLERAFANLYEDVTNRQGAAQGGPPPATYPRDLPDGGRIEASGKSQEGGDEWRPEPRFAKGDRIMPGEESTLRLPRDSVGKVVDRWFCQDCNGWHYEVNFGRGGTAWMPEKRMVPVDVGGDAAPDGWQGTPPEFTAEQEIADRQIVISFDGGPLNNGAGFARDLRPIQLAEGTYRFLEFGSDGDAVFEWGPTHYVDHSTQPDTSHGDREGADRG